MAMHRRDVLRLAATAPLMACAGGIGSRGALAQQPVNIEAAFYYGYALYEYARTMQLTRRGPALPPDESRFNRITHRRALSDATSRAVTAPNNDTLYSSAFLELSGGPVMLHVPDETTRYFSIAFMNAYTDNFAYIGTRTTDGRGGDFWIVALDWKDRVPEGVRLIRSQTCDVWMLMRTLVTGPDDIPAVVAFQDKVKMTTAPGRAPGKPLPIEVESTDKPDNFINVVSAMLGRTPEPAQGIDANSPDPKARAAMDRIITPSPVSHTQASRAREFFAAGYRPGDVKAWDSMSPELQARWREQFPGLIEKLKRGAAAGQVLRDGWAYSVATSVGNFGDDDRLRATVARSGLAALGGEEAAYFQAVNDVAGAALSGQHRYVMRIPAGGVPVDGFWSLTMYQMEPDGRRFFTPNSINRFSIGDRTPGLVRHADGGFDIFIQHEPPVDPAQRANWLPAPEGRMRLSLRAYLPRKEVRDGSWQVPGLRQRD